MNVVVRQKQGQKNIDLLKGNSVKHDKQKIDHPLPIKHYLPLLAVSFLDIHIRSEACDDPGRVPGTCGYTYIKVNGTDHSLHLRGHNVVIVDSKTGL